MGGDRGSFRPTKKPTDPLHADRRNFYKVEKWRGALPPRSLINRRKQKKWTLSRPNLL